MLSRNHGRVNEPDFEEVNEPEENIFLDRNPHRQQRYPNPNHEVSPQRVLINPQQIQSNLQVRSMQLPLDDGYEEMDEVNQQLEVSEDHQLRGD